MSEILKRRIVLMLASLLACQGFMIQVAMAAAGAPEVVINEIAWAGSQDKSSDEWIELYNQSGEEVDLSGWTIEDDGNSVYELAGKIPAKGYFVIEDAESVLNSEADFVLSISLANSGDSLVLKDSNGEIVDSVNTDGGAWFAGNSDSKATMERVDPAVSGEDADNWSSASSGNGVKASGGSPVLGTPGSVNSVFDGEGPEVIMSPGEVFVAENGEVRFVVETHGVEELYAYGFELVYDSALLNFESAEEEGFLSDGEEVAFNAALKNGEEGSLIVAGARLVDGGVSGNGELFSLNFIVTGESDEAGSISFGGTSYLSDVHGEIASAFRSAEIRVANNEVAAVKNLEAKEGEARRSIELNWESPVGGANTYIISRKNPAGDFERLAEVEENYYLDRHSLIPNVEYEYEIVPSRLGVLGEVIRVSAEDQRGLTGDNNFDDIVDGRDLEKLARAFGSEFGEEKYLIAVDMNFDGVIDGKDLMDLGVNFARSY